LGHGVLEPDLRQFRADPGARGPRKPCLAAGLEALRQRHLAQLLAQPDRRHPPARRSTPVHHHQHHGLVRRLRCVHRAPGARHRGVGRLRGYRRGLRLGRQRRAPRPGPRLQAAQFLGDGNPAGFRQLARDQRDPAQGCGARHGVAGHRPRRRCRRILAVARRAEWPGGIPRHAGRRRWHAGAVLAGTTPHAEVAVINDFDSRWAIDFQRHAANFDPVAELKAFYRPLRAQAQVVDLVSAHAPLDGYKLVVAPALNVLTDAEAARLKAYVEHGGHLVLGPRSGMKNADDGLQPQRQPGPLASVLGGRVAQFYALDKAVPVAGEAGQGSATTWAEQLQAQSPQTQVVLRYGKSNGWLDDQPAVLSRRVGKGSITYVGAWLDDGLLDRLTASWLQEADVHAPVPGVPADVEVCVRGDARHQVVILVNHAAAARRVQLPSSMWPVLAEGGASSEVSLMPYGVVVLDSREPAAANR